MPLERGRTLGHYVIQGLLGEGGMGCVYEAQDTRLKRRVALKVLPDGVAEDESRRARFEREAQAAAALNHPNIVTLHSVEHVDRTMFLTMELVEGRPLAEFVAKGPLPLPQFLAIAIPLADAVAAAHQRGLTHRDLKPANIMVTADGRPKVLDFGLAKAFADVTAGPVDPAVTQPATAEGTIVGTTAYMSPEQAEGKAVDGRSDLFSLGVVLYEMLAGERPFKGDSGVSVLSSILKDAPRPLMEINGRVPRELWQLIRRCLAKDPEKRLQSAKDLRNELEEVKQALASGELSAVSAPASPATSSGLRAGEPVARPGRRWIAAVAVVLVATAAVAAWRFWPAAEAPPASASPLDASFSVLTTQAGIEQHPSLSPDGRWMVYASDATGNSDIYLQGVGAPTPINLTKDSLADDDQPVFSPDGERIAFRSERDGGGLFVMGRTGELTRRVIDRGFNPAWSPDGGQLAFSSQSVAANPGSRGSSGAEIWVLAIATGEARRLPVTDGLQPAWSPDGARIAYWGYAPNSRNREIWTIPVGGGTPSRWTEHPAIDWNPVWAPDGRWLYFGSDRGGALGLWRLAIDPASGEPRGVPEAIQLPASLAAHFSLSADGTRLAFSSYRLATQVQVAQFDPRTGTATSAVEITRGSRTWQYLDVSSDGSRIVIASGYPQEDLFVADGDGANLRQVTSDIASDRGPRWSPDGKRLLYYAAPPGATMHVFTMGADGSDVRQITTDVPAGGSSWVFPQWSPDGSRIAAFSIGDTGYLFEPEGANAWRRIAFPRVGVDKEAFTPGAWSGDGRRIVGVAVPSNRLVVFDVEAQTYEDTSLGPFLGQQGLTWLPDSRRVLGVLNANIVLVDVASRTVTTVVDPPARQGAAQPRLTADGRRLFYLHRNDESDIALMTMK